MLLALPERGLFVSGWAGDPRRAEGLYLATIGRGLFRFVPAPSGGAGRGRGAQRSGTLRKESRAPGTTPWRFASPAVSSTTVSAGELEG